MNAFDSGDDHGSIHDDTDPTILHDSATILCDSTEINMICNSECDPDRFWLSGRSGSRFWQLCFGL